MSGFVGFSEKIFFKKYEIWIKSVGSASDATSLNISKELDSTDCSMRVFERSGF